MIQDQLVDYISSQMKLGVSEDAIKITLVGAGWSATDVEDTMKKTRAPAVAPIQPAKPAMTSPIAASSFSTGTISPMAAKGKAPESQVIRVSDLVSASSPSALSVGVTVSQQKTSPSPKNVMSPSPMGTVIQNNSSGKKEGGKGLVMTVILVVLIVIFAGLAGYFYYQNMTLATNVKTVTVQSQTVTAQISALQAQVQGENASNTAMNAQLASLTAVNQELQTDLSLFVLPSGNVTTTGITLAGTVSGGKPTYIITTISGAKASLKNSTDTIVRALLQPLVNTATTVKIGGTFIPGSSLITVLTVNGISVAPPPAAPSSTTSTAAIIPILTATSTPGL